MGQTDLWLEMTRRLVAPKIDVWSRHLVPLKNNSHLS
jgi:hypothetical protein